MFNYYYCCQNFEKVKNYVDYILVEKHKSSCCSKIIVKYSKNLIIKDEKDIKNVYTYSKLVVVWETLIVLL